MINYEDKLEYKKTSLTRQKMSLAHKGKLHSDETKLKIKKSMQKKYLIHFIKDDIKINTYNIKSFQLKEFCKVFKLSYSGLMKAKKLNKVYKKYWYITEIT